MKQNSSIMFHSTRKGLINGYIRRIMAAVICLTFYPVLVSELTAQTKWLAPSKTCFDPVKGFKPSQTDLTEIFRQISESLEYYGSPVPYLQHMKAEHTRIENLYLQKFGKKPLSHRPLFMTDDYLDRLSGNWNFLSPKLGLEPFAKDVGHMMRAAIEGTRDTGTIVIDIFNEHQSRVFKGMKQNGQPDADFEELKAQLITRLELDRKNVDEERYEMARRDAVSFALGIQGAEMQLFKYVDKALSPADAEKVKTVITSLFMDVGQMAQSELEAGIAEWAINKPSTASN